jgi:hypothetical protein
MKIDSKIPAFQPVFDFAANPHPETHPKKFYNFSGTP